MPTIKTLSFFVALFCFSLQAQALDKAHVQVSGHGFIEAMPDYISLQINIEKTSKDKAKSKTQVDQITQQVIDAAKNLQIKDKNIDASELAIYPQYEWQDNKRINKGDTVTRTVNIKLHQLNHYSDLAEALAQLDITRMQQTGHGFDQPEKWHQQALVNALNNAKQKAQVIADTYQRTLGKVYSVTDNSRGAQPTPRFAVMNRMADSKEAQSAPLKIQPQRIQVTINAVFLLK